MMPSTRLRPIDPELTPALDIAETARADEDTYSPNGQKAAGAEEPEEELDESEAAEDNEPGLEEQPRPAASRPRGQVSFFV